MPSINTIFIAFLSTLVVGSANSAVTCGNVKALYSQSGCCSSTTTSETTATCFSGDQSVDRFGFWLNDISYFNALLADIDKLKLGYEKPTVVNRSYECRITVNQIPATRWFQTGYVNETVPNARTNKATGAPYTMGELIDHTTQTQGCHINVCINAFTASVSQSYMADRFTEAGFATIQSYFVDKPNVAITQIGAQRQVYEDTRAGFHYFGQVGYGLYDQTDFSPPPPISA